MVVDVAVIARNVDVGSDEAILPELNKLLEYKLVAIVVVDELCDRVLMMLEALTNEYCDRSIFTSAGPTPELPSVPAQLLIVDKTTYGSETMEPASSPEDPKTVFDTIDKLREYTRTVAS